MRSALRKHAHVIYRDFYGCKKISRNLLIFFLIFAQSIDCGYTLEPPRSQSMLWSKNKKNKYTSAYPSFVIWATT